MTRSTQIADGVYVLLPTQFGSSNSGFVAGTDDTLVVDTRMAPLLAGELRGALEEVTPHPVTRVVNTHAHGDHVFGNQVFAPPAELISHRLARKELIETGQTAIEAFMGHYDIEARYPADVVNSIRSAQVMPAGTIFETSLDLTVSSTEVRLEFVGPAHTAGDIVVYLPETKVLFAGDLIFDGIHPYWLDGYLEGTLAALRKIKDWDVEVVVPGHGAVTDAAAIGRMLQYFETIDDLLRLTKRAGGTLEDASATISRAVGDFGAHPHRLTGTIERLWTQV